MLEEYADLMEKMNIEERKAFLKGHVDNGTSDTGGSGTLNEDSSSHSDSYKSNSSSSSSRSSSNSNSESRNDSETSEDSVPQSITDNESESSEPPLVDSTDDEQPASEPDSSNDPPGSSDDSSDEDYWMNLALRPAVRHQLNQQVVVRMTLIRYLLWIEELSPPTFLSRS
jgi:hypothetical protein